MSAPNIRLSNSDSMTTLGTQGDDFSLKYVLYSDDYYFENWTDWVNDSLNSPTNKQLENASDYENYVLKLKCTLGDSAQNKACGIKSSSKGALFIVSINAEGEIDAEDDTSTAVSNTWALTETQYDTWKAEGTPP